jgi:hypothetical protein
MKRKETSKFNRIILAGGGIIEGNSNIITQTLNQFTPVQMFIGVTAIGTTVALGTYGCVKLYKKYNNNNQVISPLGNSTSSTSDSTPLAKLEEEKHVENLITNVLVKKKKKVESLYLKSYAELKQNQPIELIENKNELIYSGTPGVVKRIESCNEIMTSLLEVEDARIAELENAQEELAEAKNKLYLAQYYGAQASTELIALRDKKSKKLLQFAYDDIFAAHAIVDEKEADLLHLQKNTNISLDELKDFVGLYQEASNLLYIEAKKKLIDENTDVVAQDYYKEEFKKYYHKDMNGYIGGHQMIITVPVNQLDGEIFNITHLNFLSSKIFGFLRNNKSFADKEVKEKLMEKYNTLFNYMDGNKKSKQVAVVVDLNYYLQL